MPAPYLRTAALSLTFALAACTSEDPESASRACPAPGKAMAAEITTAEGTLLTGPNAIGGKGDYVLRSRNAAFVIHGTRGIQKAYYHYGGILIDAVATQDCHQLAEEQFEELGLLFGKLNLTDFAASTLRGFRGETVEVINDGANGKAAHVRVTGVDDFYWLVEYELIKRTFLDGGVKTPSQPFGVAVVVDYILEPDSAVLQIDFTIENKTSATQRFMAGPEMIVGDLLRATAYGKTMVEFGGFELLSDIPFITFGSPAGSYAFAMQDARMSTANISGVNATLNLEHALTKPMEAAAGKSVTMTMFFAAGGTDDHSAAKHLPKYLPEPLAGWLLSQRPFAGTVVDEHTGAPVSGATVDVQLPNDADWLSLERYVTQADGAFGNELAYFEGANLDYRIIVSGEGRLPSLPVDFDGFPASPVALKAKPRGAVAYRIVNSAGELIPAKISLFQGGAKFAQFFVFGEGEIPVPPGSYEVSVTRGFEYGTYHGLLTVPVGKPAALDAELTWWVDTTGYLSADTHVHSAPSADSDVPIPVRIRNAAAEGLEIPVATDHEIIHGLESGIIENGLGDWVNTVSGEEYTATIPEHLTIFPVLPDGTPRGSPPPWYLHGIDEQYQAAYARGAQVVFLNHPRGGCNYLCVIGWNRDTATPTLQTPEPIGLPVTSSVWSWNFNGIEIMNGAKDPFVVAGKEDETGLFDDWQSFLNHGHKILAVGASDEHSLSELGLPRIYFASKTDQPAAFETQELVDASLSGNVLVSVGAFARVSVNGKTMGDTVSLPGGNVELTLKIEGIPEIDVTHFRVYANCDQIGAPIPVTNSAEVVKYDDVVRFTVPQDANIVVAGFGANYLPRGLPQFNPKNVPRFITNAIFIDVNNDGDFDAPGDKTCAYTRD